MPFTTLEQVKNPAKFAVTLKAELARATEKPKRFRLYDRFQDNEGERSLLVVGPLPSSLSAAIKSNGGKLLAAGACQKVGNEIHFTTDKGTTNPQKFKTAGQGGVVKAVAVENLTAEEVDEELLAELETRDTTAPSISRQEVPAAAALEARDTTPPKAPSPWEAASQNVSPGVDLKRLQMSLARSEAQSRGVLDSVRQAQGRALDLQNRYTSAEMKQDGEQMTQTLAELLRVADTMDLAVLALTRLQTLVRQQPAPDQESRQAVVEAFGPLTARLKKATDAASMVRRAHTAMQQAQQSGQTFRARDGAIEPYAADTSEIPALQQELADELKKSTRQLQTARETLTSLIPECRAIYGKVLAREPVTTTDLQALRTSQQIAAQTSKPFSGLNASAIKKWRGLASVMSSVRGAETPEILRLQKELETAYDAYNTAFGAADDIVKDLDHLIALIAKGDTPPARDQGEANQALDALLRELSDTEEKLVGSAGPIALLQGFSEFEVPEMQKAVENKLADLQVPPTATDLQNLQQLLFDCRQILVQVKANQPAIKRTEQEVLFQQKDIARRVGAQKKLDKGKLSAVVTRIKDLQKQLTESNLQAEELVNTLRQIEARLKQVVS